MLPPGKLNHNIKHPLPIPSKSSATHTKLKRYDCVAAREKHSPGRRATEKTGDCPGRVLFRLSRLGWMRVRTEDRLRFLPGKGFFLPFLSGCQTRGQKCFSLPQTGLHPTLKRAPAAASSGGHLTCEALQH